MATTNFNIRTDKAIRKHGILFELKLDISNETTVAAKEGDWSDYGTYCRR